MNYFAHLCLAKQTPESLIGNLLGDFMRGVDRRTLLPAISRGLENHIQVDRFTDTHPLIRELKELFDPDCKRFAGIALDIYFDHLLIKHWARLEARKLNKVNELLYSTLSDNLHLMPSERMRTVSSRMISGRWFDAYAHQHNALEAVRRAATRIRFANSFDRACNELLKNQNDIESAFLTFYPELAAHVQNQGIEADT
jgi:acyl carrier protein phosphodiesterase